MRSFWLGLVGLAMVGCSAKSSDYLSVEEVQQRDKYCTERGLVPVHTTTPSVDGFFVIRVTCKDTKTGEMFLSIYRRSPDVLTPQ